MARVYVGTYAKYNAGSIAGKWLDCEDYSDHDEFMAAARELHSDESDPELMFQDYEGFPREFYGESYIKPELWDWLELDESDRNIWAAYQSGVSADADFETARDAYMGTADTEKDFAESFWEETGMLDQVPEFARFYIDFDAVARDMRLGGDVTFVRYEGELYAFSNH